MLRLRRPDFRSRDRPIHQEIHPKKISSPPQYIGTYISILPKELREELERYQCPYSIRIEQLDERYNRLVVSNGLEVGILYDRTKPNYKIAEALRKGEFKFTELVHSIIVFNDKSLHIKESRVEYCPALAYAVDHMWTSAVSGPNYPSRTYIQILPPEIRMELAMYACPYAINNINGESLPEEEFKKKFVLVELVVPGIKVVLSLRKFGRPNRLEGYDVTFGLDPTGIRFRNGYMELYERSIDHWFVRIPICHDLLRLAFE